MVSVKDLCQLQGMAEIDYEAAGVSKTAAGQAIGNAMSQSVVELLMPPLLRSAGLLEEGHDCP